MKLEMVNRKQFSSASHTPSWNLCPKCFPLLKFERTCIIFSYCLSFSQLLIFTWWWRSELPLLFLMIVVLDWMETRAIEICPKGLLLWSFLPTFWSNKMLVWEMLLWTEAMWMLNRHKVSVFWHGNRLIISAWIC